MKQYLDLVKHIKENGVYRDDRTGTGTLSVFGHQMRFDINGDILPMVTTKTTHFKSVVHELIWFLKGTSKVDYLLANNITIWNEWIKEDSKIFADLDLTDRIKEIPKSKTEEFNKFKESLFSISEVEGWDYLEQRNLWRDPQVIIKQEKWLDDNNIPRRKLVGGELGPVYGVQWRHWPVRTEMRICRVVDAIRRISARNLIAELDVYLESRDSISYTDYSVDINTEEFNGYLDVSNPVHRSIEAFMLENNIPVMNNDVIESIDQIKLAVKRLKEDPYSRRHIVTAWNPAEVDNMALPPCHTFFQFYVAPLSFKEKVNCLFRSGLVRVADRKFFPDMLPEKEDYLAKTSDTSFMVDFCAWYSEQESLPKFGLKSQLYQRSADVFLGVPFNIASYALLTKMFAIVCDLEPLEFIWTGGDVHLYSNHMDQVEELLTREPLEMARVHIKKRKNLEEFSFSDFDLYHYEHHPAIKAPVAV